MPGNIRAGGAFVTISLQDNFTGPLRRIQGSIQRFGASVRNIGTAFAIPTLGAGFGFSRLLSGFAEFDDALRTTRSILGASERQFQSVEDTIRRLGATTSFTATEVANASTELARAGFSTTQALSNSLPDVLSLARSTRTEITVAAEELARISNVFGLQDNTQRVADVLSGVSNRAAGTFTDFVGAFEIGGQTVAQANIPLERAAAIFGVLSDNSITATRAGRSVRQIFQQLFQTGATADAGTIQRIRDQFNLEFDDRAARDLPSFISELSDELVGLSRVERQTIFSDLFGTISNAGINIIADNLDRIRELENEFASNQGFAQRVANAFDSGIGGSLRIARSALADFSIEFINSLEFLSPIVNTFTAVTRSITAFVASNQELFSRIAVVVAGIGILGTALVPVGVGISLLGVAFGGLTSVLISLPIAVVSTAITALSGSAGILTRTLRGLEGVVSGRGFTSFSAFGENLRDSFSGSAALFTNLGRRLILLPRLFSRATGGLGEFIRQSVFGASLLTRTISGIIGGFVGIAVVNDIFSTITGSLSALGRAATDVFEDFLRFGGQLIQTFSQFSEIVGGGFDLLRRNAALQDTDFGIEALTTRFQLAFVTTSREILKTFTDLVIGLIRVWDRFTESLAESFDTPTLRVLTFLARRVGDLGTLANESLGAIGDGASALRGLTPQDSLARNLLSGFNENRDSIQDTIARQELLQRLNQGLQELRTLRASSGENFDTQDVIANRDNAVIRRLQDQFAGTSLFRPGLGSALSRGVVKQIVDDLNSSNLQDLLIADLTPNVENSQIQTRSQGLIESVSNIQQGLDESLSRTERLFRQQDLQNNLRTIIGELDLEFTRRTGLSIDSIFKGLGDAIGRIDVFDLFGFGQSTIPTEENFQANRQQGEIVADRIQALFTTGIGFSRLAGNFDVNRVTIDASSLQPVVEAISQLQSSNREDADRLADAFGENGVTFTQ